MNPLLELARHGQSYWLDNLTREMLDTGELERRVRDEGLRGITSNPSTFQKAMTGGSAYDEEIARLAREGMSAEGIYRELVVDDIRRACDALRTVHDESDGVDGFVSLEISPHLVHDTEGSLKEARRLFALVDRPNVFIKIPGSPAGRPVVEEMLYEGVNVNITLLFSIESYEAVARAYLDAMERRLAEGKPLTGVASVASFFLSRIDVLVDRLLGQRIRSGTQGADGGPARLLGRAAVANAKLAYQSFRRIFRGERWERLAEGGARVQRVLWASTSTKNPLYSDVRYVEPLIGPDSVNTLPDRTIEAFADHGTVRGGTVEEGVDEAREVMDGLAAAGIDFEAVTWQLLNEGMEKFTAPHDKLLGTLEEHRRKAVGAPAARFSSDGARPPENALAALDERRFGTRLAARDPTLWLSNGEVPQGIEERLGWLDSAGSFRERVEEITSFAEEVRGEEIRRVLLLGMGGSSLWPEVSARVISSREGWPELLVLDSTAPEAVAAVASSIDPGSTLVVVSSKSGTTTETMSLYRHVSEVMEEAAGEFPGDRFIAITDPGSPLEAEGRRKEFRRVFRNPPEIGGRYSALSYFGLVPMALQGQDLAELLRRAEREQAGAAGSVPVGANPGMSLGAFLAMESRAGRDKVTFLAHPDLAPFAEWLEQLLAESTGKSGKGLIPVTNEPLDDPSAFGGDRVFVHLVLEGAEPSPADRLAEALRGQGRAVLRAALQDRLDLGSEAFRWEVATATAGVVLGVNPFDEPNVAESKGNTRRILEEWGQEQAMGVTAPSAVEGPLVAWSGGRAPSGDTPVDIVRRLVEGMRAGDYFAFLPYLRRTPARQEAFQRMRAGIGSRRGVATTLGWGPRYLHSSGQLHKGGPDSGVFLILTADPVTDLPIPGREYGFATLLRAQALGDFRSLSERGRRVVRLHLGEAPDGELRSLAEALA